jgi:hypothetical protein
MTLIFANACQNSFSPGKQEQGTPPVIFNAAVPDITGQPQGAVYIVGAAASVLTVTASVSDGGTLSYQWYSNTRNSNISGIPINGADGARYLPPTTVAGVMYYYVIVTNTISDNGDGGNKTATAVSAVAAIEVNDKVHAAVPVITVQPYGAVYSIDIPAAALTVTASVGDDGILSYQWYSNTVDSTTGGALIPGAAEARYRPPTAAMGTMYYYVIVSNTISDNGDGGDETAVAVSAVAAIEVNDKVNAAIPVITGQPYGGVYMVSNTAAILTVTASVSDGGTLSYQWYSNTVDSTTDGTLISGATEARYKPPTDTAGTMYYYVIVTNTISDNGDGGNKIAPVVSNVAKMELV